MRKLGLVLASVLVITGCASTPVEQPTPTPTQDAESAFIEQFRGANPDAGRATDEQWLTVAESVCAAFEAGASANQIVDSMQGSSLDADEAASVVVIASQTICPEFG